MPHEDGGSRFLRNLGISLPEHTASHPSRQQCSSVSVVAAQGSHKECLCYACMVVIAVHAVGYPHMTAALVCVQHVRGQYSASLSLCISALTELQPRMRRVDMGPLYINPFRK
jgi:hypothetical protein